MNLSTKILSDITIFNKCSKFVPNLGRRENWQELCQRNMQMHIDKFPQLQEEITKVYQEYVITKKVLPSMRSMQFAGRPIELNNSRQFNCAYLPIDDYRAFSEIMFLLLGGTGVGFSVQKAHISKLPTIKKPIKSRRFLIADSIEGWADAVKALISAYMINKPFPIFDYSDIRKKGAALITAGGKAPGPQPLKDCIHNLKKILDAKQDGDQLLSIEVHDLVCFIADAVLAGGIRRSALISLFDLDNEDMLSCKSGSWWELNPQRARANNSPVLLRHKIKKQDFFNLLERIKASGCGEPGFLFSNNADWGTNPCSEIGLRPFQFCNLCEINMNDLISQEDLNQRSKAAAFLGTLQASYTNFHYLRDIWKRTTEKDALIGISGTGIASLTYFPLNLTEATAFIAGENERVAKIIGINKAARQTTNKPSGTTSCVLGTSSGIHAWFDQYYIRRMKLGKNEAIYQYLKNKIPELIEDDFFRSHQDAFITIPIAAPEGSVVAPKESALELLERIKHFSQFWIKPGHIKGDNSHNVSATIYVKPDEWEEVGHWMWENREFYNGLSLLPFDGGSYKQTPFESITQEKYQEMIQYLKEVDLSEIVEIQDETNLSGELACSGGACEVV